MAPGCIDHEVAYYTPVIKTNFWLLAGFFSGVHLYFHNVVLNISSDFCMIFS